MDGSALDGSISRRTPPPHECSPQPPSHPVLIGSFGLVEEVMTGGVEVVIESGIVSEDVYIEVTGGVEVVVGSDIVSEDVYIEVMGGSEVFGGGLTTDSDVCGFPTLVDSEPPPTDEPLPPLPPTLS